jgi:uncharacterized membrane protein YccC
VRNTTNRPGTNDGARVWATAQPAVLFGIRLWAAVVLALLVAYWLELDNAYWAGTSASIVCQPSLGLSLRKGRFRLVGTMIGAAAAVVLTALLPQSRTGFLVGLALWGAASAFVATVLQGFASYAAALAGYTTAIVFSDAVDNPGNAFHLAITRGTEISIGVICAGIVLLLTDFGGARQRLMTAMSETAGAVATGIARTAAAGIETPDSRRLRRELIRKVVMLNAVIDEAIGEASDLRVRARTLLGAVEGLFCALAAWRGMANHIERMPEAARARLSMLIKPAIEEVTRFCWGEDLLRTRAICEAASHSLANTEVRDVAGTILLDSAIAAVDGLARAVNALILVAAPGREHEDRRRYWLYITDPLPAFVNAVRAATTIGVAEVIWTGTSWSGGQSVITFAAIAAILFGPRAETAYETALQYIVGTVLTAGLAGLVKFLILTRVQTFIGFSAILAFVMIPLGACAARPWRPIVFMAMVTNFLPLLAPSNVQVYDLAAFLNVAMAMIAGILVACLLLVVIPPVSPQLRAQRLLFLTLRDVRRIALQTSRPSVEQWVGRVSSRLAALPSEATLNQLARLIAALSVGQALIVLRDAQESPRGRNELERACVCLAWPDLAGARQHLLSFSEHQAEERVQEAATLRARASAAIILEALDRHSAFFEAPSIRAFRIL